jgi:hypothetical protein
VDAVVVWPTPGTGRAHLEFAAGIGGSGCAAGHCYGVVLAPWHVFLARAGARSEPGFPCRDIGRRKLVFPIALSWNVRPRHAGLAL